MEMEPGDQFNIELFFPRITLRTSRPYKILNKRTTKSDPEFTFIISGDARISIPCHRYISGEAIIDSDDLPSPKAQHLDGNRWLNDIKLLKLVFQQKRLIRIHQQKQIIENPEENDLLLEVIRIRAEIQEIECQLEKIPDYDSSGRRAKLAGDKSVAEEILKRAEAKLAEKKKVISRPALQEEEYLKILESIRRSGDSFESMPRTYVPHNEEQLRDFILGNLNNNFDGVMSEAFHYTGHTDILMKEKVRGAFVAECKIWRGPGAVAKAIDQLLGYLTWKDAHTSLIFINKNIAGFTALQDKMTDYIKKHNCCIEEIQLSLTGEWRYKFRSANDSGNIIIMHVFLFNIYVENKK